MMTETETSGQDTPDGTDAGAPEQRASAGAGRAGDATSDAGDRDGSTGGGRRGDATTDTGDRDGSTGAGWTGDATTEVGAHRPPPSAPPADSRNLAVVAHLSSLVGLAGVPGFIGPLVVWLLHRDRDPWVAEHARDALNFNLSLLIYAGGALALTVLTLGLGLLVVVPAAIIAVAGWLVVTILAAIRAADGDRYRYPLTLQLIS